jgi:glycosyltransferase involved in cell wall biosynthesis
MLLSILIPTLACRKHFLDRLLGELEPQLAGRNAVEVLIDSDSGESRTGTKRNRLVHRASGEYVCGIDDDDRVSADYIARTVDALKTRPDCVGWRMKRYSDGELFGEGIHSITVGTNRGRETVDGKVMYYRTPNHLNPIRRDIAIQIPFPDINVGEDWAFAVQVFPHLKTEQFIDDYLYHYYYRTMLNRAGEGVER